MNEQDGRQVTILQHPPTNDPKAWKAHWEAQGQSWRTEPEIAEERQQVFAKLQSITPNIEQGDYPFKGIKLNRADVEWLLATHENGQGPIDWNDERQRTREGLDLRGADLRKADLHELPLARTKSGLKWLTTTDEWLSTTSEHLEIARIHLEGANLKKAHLEGACLINADLQEAYLVGAYLNEANLSGSLLEWAYLVEAHLEDANLTRAILAKTNLRRANLHRANLTGAYFDAITDFEKAVLGDKKLGFASLGDITWGGANITVIDWRPVDMLGEERKAQKSKRLEDYQIAVRANRQIAVALQTQGLNEDADHFSYRAQKLQRVVLRRQRSWLKYAFSWMLAVVAGYGYKPYLCFVIYFLALLGFTLAHYIVGALDGHALTFMNALAVSVQSLHGRLFSFQSSDPQTLLNTIEAFVGLFIEAIVVAVITQRILGK